VSHWDGLIVGALWKKCGHPKTPENTLINGRRPRCRTCHNQRSRDWWERHRIEAKDAAFEALSEEPRAFILGGEFLRARIRYEMSHRRRA
jgi:hypothetical protein